MIHDFIDLDTFESILPFIDWKIEHQTNDLLARANDRTSISYVADCYVALPDHDAAAAQKLIRKRLPKGWEGWPVIVSAARRRRKAFRQAVAMGVLSDDPKAENYRGHYFYWRSEKGKDHFKHRRTFHCVESPYSQGEVRKLELNLARPWRCEQRQRKR